MRDRIERLDRSGEHPRSDWHSKFSDSLEAFVDVDYFAGDHRIRFRLLTKILVVLHQHLSFGRSVGPES